MYSKEGRFLHCDQSMGEIKTKNIFKKFEYTKSILLDILSGFCGN